jgi:type II secretory pathway pseudopilin PulG
MARIAKRNRATRTAAKVGFTMVEALIAISVIVAALLTTIGAMSSSMRASRTVDEREAAVRAVAAKVAEIEAADFAALFANYDPDPNDDPLGPGTAPGATFDIPNFKAQDGSASPVGSIVLPMIGGQLREDADMPELGMPRDLNGDGKIDALDHKSDYQLLPILVRASWHGIDGDASITIEKLLSAK